MTTKVLRKLVHIDEDKCDGCGACVISCAEGALKIIDGKARLVSEKYCDGLGACLGKCPEDAITVEEQWSEDFNEEAVKDFQQATETHDAHVHACPGAAMRDLTADKPEPLPCGCAGSMVQELAPAEAQETPAVASALRHWPVQLTLVPAFAPFLKDADVVLTADCVPFAYGNFHRDFIKDRAVLVACPKLDNFSQHQQKLVQVLRLSGLKSLTVVHMEVPCCSGLVHMAEEAMSMSGNKVPFKDVTIGVKGEIKSVRQNQD